MTSIQKAGITASLIVAALAVLYWLTPYLSTHLIWALRASSFVWIPLLIVAALGVACWLSGEFVIGALAVGAGLATAGFWFFHSYAVDKEYASSVVAVSASDDHLPEMGVRAPYSVAQAQSRTTLSGVAGADLILGSTAYDPATGHFTTLAKGREMLNNYAAVAVQTFPTTGRSTGTQCVFSEDAHRSLDGWFTHSLGRAINSERRNVSWEDDDAYGLCAKDGTPLVVVPLTKQKGWLWVTEVPAGVAVYNGQTGVTTVSDTVPEGITGPTYPMSLAKTQREATDATGTWMQWFRNLIGWDAAAGNANHENPSELVLGTDGGEAVYATPLTLKGTSTGISAVSTVRADTFTAGELNPLVIRTVKPTWVSIDAIEARIRADYQDIPNWQNLHVQEVAPVDDGRWVATIGNDQNTLYRVIGSGDLSPLPKVENDAATCLYQGMEAKMIRCGTRALTDGSGIGTQYGPNDGTPAAAPPVSVDGPLSKMSDKELTDLLRRLADELERRNGGG